VITGVVCARLATDSSTSAGSRVKALAIIAMQKSSVWVAEYHQICLQIYLGILIIAWIKCFQDSVFS
jgi:hypothetical protein